MRTIKNIENKRQILLENYESYLNDSSNLEEFLEKESFEEFVRREKESDPSFYRFIFNDYEIEDYGNDNEDDDEVVDKFIDSLQNPVFVDIARAYADAQVFSSDYETYFEHVQRFIEIANNVSE